MRERFIRGKISDFEQLFEAVAKAAVGQVDKLLSRGVSPDCRDSKGRTPLIVAAEVGNAPLVGVFIRHRADVNCVDNDGETAVMKAAYGGHRDVVELLRANGADEDLRNNEGMTAMEIAEEMEAHDVVAYLAAQQRSSSLHSSSPDEPDDDGPSTPSPAAPGAAASVASAMAPAPQPSSYVPELNIESIPAIAESPFFKAQQEPEIAVGALGKETAAPSLDAGAEHAAEAWSAIRGGHGTVRGKKTETRPALPDSVPTANEERIVFDALDNKQVRNICEKIKKVLDKAGFEVGDYVIDTVFKGSPMAVLKPRSQENKRWRKLKKHPDWIIDPRRLTELIGGCAVRRLCLAEGIDVSSFSLSHFIELYYAKDLKLILMLAEEASTNKYTVRQLKKAVDDLREHKDDHDPGKEIIRTLDQAVPILEDPDLMALCTDKDRVLEELSKAERKKIRALIKERKPGLDEWKNLMDTFEGILSDLEDE